MSGINGDKARFHRMRKQKIHRRERNRRMFQPGVERSNAALPPLDAKTKGRPA
jgi:hypothetical protein